MGSRVAGVQAQRSAKGQLGDCPPHRPTSAQGGVHRGQAPQLRFVPPSLPATTRSSPPRRARSRLLSFLWKRCCSNSPRGGEGCARTAVRAARRGALQERQRARAGKGQREHERVRWGRREWSSFGSEARADASQQRQKTSNLNAKVIDLENRLTALQSENSRLSTKVRFPPPLCPPRKLTPLAVLPHLHRPLRPRPLAQPLRLQVPSLHLRPPSPSSHPRSTLPAPSAPIKLRLRASRNDDRRFSRRPTRARSR